MRGPDRPTNGVGGRASRATDAPKNRPSPTLIQRIPLSQSVTALVIDGAAFVSGRLTRPWLFTFFIITIIIVVVIIVVAVVFDSRNVGRTSVSTREPILTHFNPFLSRWISLEPNELGSTQFNPVEPTLKTLARKKPC